MTNSQVSSNVRWEKGTHDSLLGAQGNTLLILFGNVSPISLLNLLPNDHSPSGASSRR